MGLYGRHTNFNGFLIATEVDEGKRHFPVLPTEYESLTMCECCDEHEGIYEIVDQEAQATTLLCQACAVEQANATELGNPDTWIMSPEMSRIVLPGGRHRYGRLFHPVERKF